MTANDAWRQLYRAARGRLSPSLMRSLFTGTSGVALRDDRLVVAVPTASAKAHLEKRCLPLLTPLAERLWKRPVRIEFVLGAHHAPSAAVVVAHTQAASVAEVAPAHLAPAATRYLTAHSGLAKRTLFTPPELNPQYTFERYIEGGSNRFAYAAARSVATSPGQAYNPLFLYGDVGLGKTHLLMAIGHVAAGQGLRVGYITTDGLTHAIVDAIQHKTQEELRAKYRELDVLLIDDIQFLAGQEATQFEFFHTFNALHNANKQIVVTSDRPPRDIPTLHDRLRSRFEWGLLADIDSPDYPHRLAIVRAKAATMNAKLPDTILEYIARPEVTNIRQIEGALHRVTLAAQTHGGTLTLAQAAATLRQCFGDRAALDISPQVILDLVANHYHVSAEELCGKGRSRNVAWPRQVAMWLMRESTDISLAQIGAALGGRDHTTIMHGCEQVTALIKHDESLRHEIEKLRAALRAM